jgi:hypothetical protein
MRSVALPPSSHARGRCEDLTPDRAIEVLLERLETASRHRPPGEVRVPTEALRVVLGLVEGGSWDEFDGHRRWAGPWQRSPNVPWG